MRTNNLGENEFYGLTERGEVVWKYPYYNDYTVVPPLYGVWVGINSPNNSVPVYGFVNAEDIP